ncbi:hypothetical protein Scep_020054 [Stephania cephalantha]|uniref:Uncharacterized protein n=1 Tax=Stephania cephalantha TaxID=152367 RepID=A0AAP0IC31_9MAGN
MEGGWRRGTVKAALVERGTVEDGGGGDGGGEDGLGTVEARDGARTVESRREGDQRDCEGSARTVEAGRWRRGRWRRGRWRRGRSRVPAAARGDGRSETTQASERGTRTRGGLVTAGCGARWPATTLRRRPTEDVETRAALEPVVAREPVADGGGRPANQQRRVPLAMRRGRAAGCWRRAKRTPARNLTAAHAGAAKAAARLRQRRSDASERHERRRRGTAAAPANGSDIDSGVGAAAMRRGSDAARQRQRRGGALSDRLILDEGCDSTTFDDAMDYGF